MRTVCACLNYVTAIHPFSLFPLSMVMESITAGIGIDIDPSLEDYSLPSINPIPYRSAQNVEPLRNEDSSANPKKRKMMKLSNGLEIPEPHWSAHKPTTHAGVIKEMYGPKLKLHQRSRGRFKASSIFFFEELN